MNCPRCNHRLYGLFDRESSELTGYGCPKCDTHHTKEIVQLSTALRELQQAGNLGIVDLAVYSVPAPAPAIDVEGVETGEQRVIGVGAYWRFDVYVDMQAFVASHGLPSRVLPSDTFRTGGVLSDAQINAEESLVDTLAAAIERECLLAYAMPEHVIERNTFKGEVKKIDPRDLGLE